MLPDFPETKILFSRFFQTYMRRKAREISPYGVVQTRYLHEGRAMKITRADQSESDGLPAGRRDRLGSSDRPSATTYRHCERPSVPKPRSMSHHP